MFDFQVKSIPTFQTVQSKSGQADKPGGKTDNGFAQVIS